MSNYQQFILFNESLPRIVYLHVPYYMQSEINTNQTVKEQIKAPIHD